MSNEDVLKNEIKNLKKISTNKKYHEIVDSIKTWNYSKKESASIDLGLIHRFVPAPEIGYSVICYRATKVAIDPTDDKKHVHIESIYAFVYVDVKVDDKNIYIVPKYVCASPTYASRDGEYRQRYIPFSQVLSAKTQYPELWSAAEEEVLSKMMETYLADDIYDKYTIPIEGGAETSAIMSGDMIFNADVYPSEEDMELSEVLKKWANNSRMAIHLYIAAFLVDGLNIYNNLEENHINENYKIIIYDDDNDTEFFDKWTSASEFKIQLNKCVYILSFIQTQSECETSFLKIGQKIIPLTIQEVLTRDVALGVWKEIIISNLCSNLVINGIAPGFAVSGPWFFLQGVDSGLYDNMAMHEKFNFSADILNINTMLKEAKELVWRDGNAGTADLDSLAKQINDVLRYSAAYVTITDVSIVSLSQWIGSTVRDWPRMLRNYRLNKQNVAWVTSHTFDNPDVFTKYIFDWIFSCHAMNSRMGILHGDLHLNNITVHKFIDLVKLVDGVQEFKVGPDPMSMYVVPPINSAGQMLDTFDPEKNIYCFDSYGYCGGIIDYSRAIVSSLETIRKYDKDVLHDAEYVQRRQKESLLRLYHKYLPDIVDKNELKVKALILEKFELMVKIAFAIDPFNIADNVHLLLESEFPNTFKKLRTGKDIMRNFPPPQEVQLTPEEEGILDPSIPKLLAGIRDFAREWLISNLIRAINDDLKFPEDVPWVGELIINKFFGGYTIAGRKDDFTEYNIYDCFNLCSELKYSSFNPAHFEHPPEVLQTTIRSEKTKELHNQEILKYLEKVRKLPETTAKVETLKSRFQEIPKLPVESMWKYDKM
jgi:hypothetical protein